MNKPISFLLTFAFLPYGALFAQDDATEAVARAVKAIEATINQSGEAASNSSSQADSIQDEESQVALVDREAIALPEQPETEDSLEPLIKEIEVASEPVRVDEIITSDHSEVTLHTPWKPKPMQDAPRGWRYIMGHKEQAYPATILLSNKKKIKVDIIPYVLAPEESDQTALVVEPGYLPELGYAQTKSVSATISSSNKELEFAEQQLETSIQKLKQLMVSLPQ